MSAAAIHSLPCSLNNAARIASRLGIPIRAISLHRFPDEELRVTIGSAAATSIIYATLDRPAEKLLAIMFAAEALGAMARSGWSSSRRTCATCVRILLSATAKRSARR